MEEIREKSNVLQCHPELDSGSRGKYMRFRVPPVGGQAWHGMTAHRIPPPALPAGRQGWRTGMSMREHGATTLLRFFADEYEIFCDLDQSNFNKAKSANDSPMDRFERYRADDRLDSRCINRGTQQ